MSLPQPTLQVQVVRFFRGVKEGFESGKGARYPSLYGAYEERVGYGSIVKG
jgi:hypothetical protein